MQMRIRRSIFRPRREVDELRPNEVARFSIAIATTGTNPRCGFVFQFFHRLAHRLPERVQNVLILCVFVNDGHGLGQVEVEVIANPTIGHEPGRSTMGRRCLH